jgi:HK97 family phage prohead protease
MSVAIKRKFRDFEFEVKEVSEKGDFSGYGSVYNVVDVFRERVAPGAFQKSLEKWKSKSRLPPVLWQHNSREPVGPYTLMREDDKGLYVEGKLLIGDVQKATEAHALMKAKAVSGLSIGFNTVVEEFDKKENIITLKEVDLWEVSIVTFPANEDARIEQVKAAFGEGKMPTVREFEEILRDVGYSQKQAKLIVGHGYAALQRDVDSGNQTNVKSVLDELFKQPVITAEEIFR